MSDLIVRPQVIMTNESFNESSLFETLGTTRLSGGITIIGGTRQAGSVRVTIPVGVVRPNEIPSNSATWSNVSLESLAGVTFVIVPAAETTSSTSSATGGIPKFPGTPVVAGAFAIALAVVYLTARRRLQRHIAPPI
jgi:hypothetical protein